MSDVPIPGRESWPDLGRDDAVTRPTVTIYDVAKVAGVSIATVSHTLNRPHKVSPATRAKVMAIVDELHFVPKATAISQARRDVGRIGVLAPFTSYPSYGQRLLGVLAERAEDAVDVVVFDHGSVADAPSPLLSTLPATGRLDGMIIMGVPLDTQLAERLQKRKLATVLVDSTFAGFSSVNVDDIAGGRAVGAHLVERGHRTFAFVSEGQRSADYVSPGQLRLKGFTEAVASAGVSGGDLRWVYTENGVGGGRQAADRIAAAPDRPTAVFAHHDAFAAGLVMRFRELGVRVPDDIAVAGYDGSELAVALDITTVAQPFTETGRLAAETLADLVGQPASPVRQVLLQPELRVGSTT